MTDAEDEAARMLTEARRVVDGIEEAHAALLARHRLVQRERDAALTERDHAVQEREAAIASRDRWAEDLRQEQLRHQIAERDVIGLTSELDRLGDQVDRLRGLCREVDGVLASCTAHILPVVAGHATGASAHPCGRCLPCRVRAEATR